MGQTINISIPGKPKSGGWDGFNLNRMQIYLGILDA